MNNILSPRTSRRFSLKSSKVVIIVLLIVLALLGLGVGGYFYYQYQQNLPKNQAQRNLEEAKKLSQQVGKFILLPSDELPTIATVTDISKLRSQDFFKFAKNGDKVLIFAKAKIAIIYSPSINKIINIGPVNIGDQPNQTPQAKIAILNGTVIEGLAGKEQTNLQIAFPGANIVKTGAANSNDYLKTIIVIFNPLAKNAGQALATFYNAAVTNLPSTESPEDGVDILIILGKDRGNLLTPSVSPVQAKSTAVHK